MNLSLGAQAHGAKVGNLHGWALGFLDQGTPGEAVSLLLTSSDYHAAIDVALPDGLAGGRVQVVIDALTDAHYRTIRTKAAAELFLFWQDVNASLLGVVAGISGLGGLARGPSAADLAPALVCRFAVSMKRRPGPRGYETVIEGNDQAFTRLSRIAAPHQCYPSLVASLDAIGQAAAVRVLPAPDAATLMGQVVTPEDEQTQGAAGLSCAGALLAIGSRIAAGSHDPAIPALRSDAPPVLLLRDGTLHVGRRPIPFPAGSAAQTLTPGSGLVESTHGGTGGGAGGGAGGGTVPPRWTLLCRGRPDLKPGDVVRFKAPAEDVATTLPGAALALLGSLAGPILGAVPEEPDTTILVTDVAHRQSRAAGFTTTLGGVALPEVLPADPWSVFHVAAAADDGSGTVPRTAPGGDAATAVGRQVRDLARSALRQVRLPEVAEVRAAVSKTGTPPEPPAQTVMVWAGTGLPTGQPNPSRRRPIGRDEPFERRGVATVTPFAWGECGLAVPRYPGMRVVLGYGNGQVEDPMDMGALWGPGARMQAEAGDWWLKLPVDQPTAPLTGTAEHLPGGQAVNDLTDAAGVRVIEAGKLTIRVGTPLGAIGDRPQHKAAATVSIEHADGKASITIDQDGAITITGKTIALEAPGGTVSINAKDVNVTVSHQMQVT